MPARCGGWCHWYYPGAVSERSADDGCVFISYVREDSRRVDQLQEVFEAAGIAVWRDTARLWPGQDWRAEIRKAITQDALVFVACFSGASVSQIVGHQNEELRLAVDQMRRRRPGIPWFIPVRFDDCDVPDLDIGGGITLASIQHVDLFGPKEHAGIGSLIAGVLRILRQTATLGSRQGGELYGAPGEPKRSLGLTEETRDVPDSRASSTTTGT